MLSTDKSPNLQIPPLSENYQFNSLQQVQESIIPFEIVVCEQIGSIIEKRCLIARNYTNQLQNLHHYCINTIDRIQNKNINQVVQLLFESYKQLFKNLQKNIQFQMKKSLQYTQSFTKTVYNAYNLIKKGQRQNIYKLLKNGILSEQNHYQSTNNLKLQIQQLKKQKQQYDRQLKKNILINNSSILTRKQQKRISIKDMQNQVYIQQLIDIIQKRKVMIELVQKKIQQSEKVRKNLIMKFQNLINKENRNFIKIINQYNELLYPNEQKDCQKYLNNKQLNLKLQLKNYLIPHEINNNIQLNRYLKSLSQLSIKTRSQKYNYAINNNYLEQLQNKIKNNENTIQQLSVHTSKKTIKRSEKLTLMINFWNKIYWNFGKQNNNSKEFLFNQFKNLINGDIYSRIDFYYCLQSTSQKNHQKNIYQLNCSNNQQINFFIKLIKCFLIKTQEQFDIINSKNMMDLVFKLKFKLNCQNTFSVPLEKSLKNIMNWKHIEWWQAIFIETLINQYPLNKEEESKSNEPKQNQKSKLKKTNSLFFQWFFQESTNKNNNFQENQEENLKIIEDNKFKQQIENLLKTWLRRMNILCNNQQIVQQFLNSVFQLLQINHQQYQNFRNMIVQVKEKNYGMKTQFYALSNDIKLK